MIIPFPGFLKECFKTAIAFEHGVFSSKGKLLLEELIYGEMHNEAGKSLLLKELIDKLALSRVHDIGEPISYRNLIPLQTQRGVVEECSTARRSLPVQPEWQRSLSFPTRVSLPRSPLGNMWKTSRINGIERA
jgi:hypothetical protein